MKKILCLSFILFSLSAIAGEYLLGPINTTGTSEPFDTFKTNWTKKEKLQQIATQNAIDIAVEELQRECRNTHQGKIHLDSVHGVEEACSVTYGGGPIVKFFCYVNTTAVCLN